MPLHDPPTLAIKRVQNNAAGQMGPELKTPWRDGATHVAMPPLDFTQRLAASVPRPRLHLIRLRGLLAPSSTTSVKLRPLVPPQESEPATRRQGVTRRRHPESRFSVGLSTPNGSALPSKTDSNEVGRRVQGAVEKDRARSKNLSSLATSVRRHSAQSTARPGRLAELFRPPPSCISDLLGAFPCIEAL